MRSVTLSFDGHEYDVPVTWANASEFARRIADPLDIAEDMRLRSEAVAAGVPYAPRFPFNLVNSVRIVRLALSWAGEKLGEDEIGGIALRNGTGELVTAAVRVVTAMVSSGDAGADDDAPGEGGGDRPGKKADGSGPGAT